MHKYYRAKQKRDGSTRSLLHNAMQKRLLAASIHSVQWNSSYRKTSTRTTATDLETPRHFGSRYQFALRVLYTVSPTHSCTLASTLVFRSFATANSYIAIFMLLIRKLEECLDELGGKVGEVWFDGDVPLFHVKFHTRRL